MNPIFSDDPVERILAMVHVRPPIPLPAWVRRPSTGRAWDYPLRITAAELAKLPTFHERHVDAALHHDVFAVRDAGVTWAIGRVVWRSAEPEGKRRRMPEGARAQVVFRPPKVVPTLAELEQELLDERAARAGFPKEEGAMAKVSVFEDPDHYPGLVLLQPWAGLMWLAGFGWPGKVIESRTFQTSLRGPFVAVAGHGTCDDAPAALALGRSLLVATGLVDAALFELVTSVRGVALARFHVAGCRRLRAEDERLSFFWKADRPRHAWLASRVEALEPFKVQGSGQGFFRVPRAAADAAVLASTDLEHAS